MGSVRNETFSILPLSSVKVHAVPAQLTYPCALSTLRWGPISLFYSPFVELVPSKLQRVSPRAVHTHGRAPLGVLPRRRVGV